MKKLFITGIIAALAFSSVAQAELQISANVTTITAYQHDDKDAANAGNGAGGITMGDMGWSNTANADHFGFLVDDAQISLENEFGENVMARIDVDFGDMGVTAATTWILLEQAYVTANLGIGNGMEFLIGKFNVPLGISSVDRRENVFITYTSGFWHLMPKQTIGAKLYYEFNEHWNFDFALVNNLNDAWAIQGNSAYPSGILRVGVQWGDEGRQSYVHLGAGYGPEATVTRQGVSQNKHMDMLGVLWGNFAIGDYWDLGWEGIYRQSNSLRGGANQKAIDGQLYVVYQPSDEWTVQLRGEYFWEVNPANARGGSGASTTGATWSGFEGSLMSGTFGATYLITDGAQMKLEYRFDYAKVAGNANNADFHTAAAEFSYSF